MLNVSKSGREKGFQIEAAFRNRQKWLEGQSQKVQFCWKAATGNRQRFCMKTHMKHIPSPISAIFPNTFYFFDVADIGRYQKKKTASLPAGNCHAMAKELITAWLGKLSAPGQRSTSQLDIWSVSHRAGGGGPFSQIWH